MQRMHISALREHTMPMQTWTGRCHAAPDSSANRARLLCAAWLASSAKVVKSCSAVSCSTASCAGKMLGTVCCACSDCSGSECSMPDDHEHGLDMSSAPLASSARLHRL